jgi:hypothetical protein
MLGNVLLLPTESLDLGDDGVNRRPRRHGWQFGSAERRQPLNQYCYRSFQFSLQMPSKENTGKHEEFHPSKSGKESRGGNMRRFTHHARKRGETYDP